MDQIEKSMAEAGGQLADLFSQSPAPGPQAVYGTVAVNSWPTLDVVVRGALLKGVPATSCCRAASPGDRAVMLADGALLTAIGIIER